MARRLRVTTTGGQRANRDTWNTKQARDQLSVACHQCWSTDALSSMSFDTERFIIEVEKRPQLYDSHSEDYKNRAVSSRCWSEVGEIMYPDEWPTLNPSTKKTRVKLLIKKWKTLRDNFVREYKDNLFQAKKKVTNRRKKSYYKRLQFLQPYIRGQAAAARIENVVNCDLEFPANNEIYENGDPLILQEGDVYEDSTSMPDGFADVKPVIDIVELNQSQSVVSPASPQPILSPSRRSNCVAVALKSKKTAIRRSVIASALKSAVESEEDLYGHRAFMMSYIPILNSMPLHAAMQARMQISQVINLSFVENSSHATPTSIVTDNSELN